MRSKEITIKKSKNKKLEPANYLIVCEGRQTEPNYFNGLKNEINKKFGNKVDVLIPNIDVKGTGLNTLSLIKYTKRKVSLSNKVYGKVWVVFDKDDYTSVQFDLAVLNCEYNVAWSNPNFELWILSHFKFIDRFISKENVLIELEKEFKKLNLGLYQKNDKEIYSKISNNKGVEKAIKNCNRMSKLNITLRPSERNPMTTVYEIIDDLKEYL